MATIILSAVAFTKKNFSRSESVCFSWADWRFEVISQVPYSLDQASSDFWLFQTMKYIFRGRTFSSRADTVLATFQWSKQTFKVAFAAAMESWLRRWEKYVRLLGDYVKK